MLSDASAFVASDRDHAIQPLSTFSACFNASGRLLGQLISESIVVAIGREGLAGTVEDQTA